MMIWKNAPVTAPGTLLGHEPGQPVSRLADDVAHLVPQVERFDLHSLVFKI